MGFINSYDFDRSQLTWTTDGANAGTVFLREGKHNCTNVCGTLLPKSEINSLHYMKYSLEYIAIYHKRADTNGYKIMNNEMAEIKLTLPPLIQQQAIANFLDQKVSEIDHILKKTRESIEEYKKYKQSLITEAVTKGLNPDVEMKDSGIEWIGEIPKHWDTKKMKYCVKLRNEKGIFNKEIDHYIGLENIESFSGRYIKTESLYEGGTYDIFKNGDILFNRLRPYLTKCLMPIFDGFCTGELLIIKEFEGFKKYLFYYLISSKFIDVLNSSTYGTKMPRVSWEFMKELCLTLPNIQEQNQIVNYLDIKCTEIDSLISQKEALLSDLELYKKSLIYEYVTGKREVD